MSAIKVDIDADAVNKMVSEAILQSCLGESIQRVLKEEVERLSKNYHNDAPIQREVRRMLLEEVSKLIHNEYRDKLREIVKAQMTEEMLSKMTTALFESWRQHL